MTSTNITTQWSKNAEYYFLGRLILDLFLNKNCNTNKKLLLYVSLKLKTLEIIGIIFVKHE